jgi:multidrug resistance efflux pump
LENRKLPGRVQALSLSRLPERTSSLGRNLVWLGVLCCAVGGAWYGYTRFFGASESGSQAAGVKTPKATSSTVASQPASRPPLDKATAPAAVTTATAKGDVILEAKGYIIPAHQILVSPKVSGMILTLNVEEGKRVEKGAILAVLESTDYAADRDRAKANARLMRERLRELENGNRPEEIKKTEAELFENEAMLVQLDADFKRTEDLRRRNSVTQQDLELAESKFLAQKQRVASMRFAHELMKLGPRVERIDIAKAELAQAEADVVKAEWRLGNCTIRAPISGTILKKNAEEGNIVNPIAFNGSFSLCEMADLSDLEVDLNIQERDISVVEVGQKCRIRAEAYPNRIYEGVVDRLMPIADRAKGAIPVRVKISVPAAEEGVYLKPEMGAIVTFLHGSAGSAGAIAAAAEAPPVSPAP